MAYKDPYHQLVQWIKDDSRDRSEWEERAHSLQDHRLGKRKKNTLYPNAPNFNEPIIDDNVRDAVSQEMAVLYSTKQLANFLGLNQMAVEHHREAEMGFDTMLRMLLGFRKKSENAIDNKRSMGFCILKLAENDTAYRRFLGPAMEVPETSGVLPDMEVVNPYDLVTPTNTEDLRDAERICHVHRYSPRMLRELGEKRQWDNVDKIITMSGVKPGEEEEGDESPASDVDGIGKPLMISQEDTSITVKEIDVWEIYHYDEDDVPTRTILCPHHPKHVLESEPWIWGDTGERRVWPFVQLRNENRETSFYDTRGDAELLLDNQKAATAYMNAKAVQLDYFAKPMFTGAKKNRQKIRFEPGSFLPEGVEPLQMPQVSSVFDFGSDAERMKAARRTGASQGGFSGGRQRGEDKTATQVNAEQLNATRQVNVSAVRDGDGWGEFFFMMWEFLRHNPIPLPMFENGGEFRGISSMEIYQMPFLIQSAANSQNANPDFVLQQMMTLGPMLQQSEWVRQDRLMGLIVDQINPQMTSELIVNPEAMGPQGQPSINQQMMQMQQGMQQMMQALQGLGQQVQSLTEYATQQAEADMEEAQEAEQAQAREGQLEVA